MHMLGWLFVAFLWRSSSSSKESEADRLVLSSRPKEAIAFIEPLLGQPDSDSPALRINLARAYTQLRDNDAAERVLLELLGSFPGNPEGLVALSKLQLYKQKFNDAEVTLTRLADIDARNSSVIVGFSKLYAFRDRDCTKAVNNLKRLQSNSDASAYFDAGMIFFHCGELDLGKQAFEMSESIGHDIDHKLLGRLYFTYHRYDWSMHELQRHLEANQNHSSDVDVLLLLAETKDVLGFPREAERLLRTVIAAQPNHAVAHGTPLPPVAMHRS